MGEGRIVVNTEGYGKNIALIWRQITALWTRYMDERTRNINHREIISELVRRAEMSEGYLSSIILANLIALLGLLTNSVAVVIGAMLISPLMGPIFSLGLAFTMGDLVLSRRALRTIASSILLTVVVAAIFSLLSPLKEPTHEILARTRPNVYDLLIAVFAGAAGALALCTRKNYLFTTTGVAVATAVIPPLSVVGYGLGTWQLAIAAGGFLLFFTNLVAIVISSDLLFYLFRFRGSMAMESAYPVRKRLQIMGVLLVVISIPLMITLVNDIRKVNLTRRVEGILKSHFNVKRQSRLTTVAIGKDNGTLTVNASINTVKYVDSGTRTRVEGELVGRLGRPVDLELEQVIVRSGAVEPPTQLRPVIPVAAPQPETLKTLREKSLERLSEGCREVETYIAPYRLSGCSITFAEGEHPVSVELTMLRDDRPEPQELRWLRAALEQKLQERIALRVEARPLLPPPVFDDKDELDQPSRTSLALLGPMAGRLPEYRVQLEIPRERRSAAARTKRQLSQLKGYLIKEVGIPEERIRVVTGKERTIRVFFRK
jgi:uncharacterized hydrophobic protein (TIGR00271 family)